ncbi:hypothetical protein DSM112329_00970 [Paraconexibacter sp. AEG42_29]|uniref:Aspartate kinase n=1 Tax=Paraconexibacter sp. AEG42_29 TaxID=2997339 RepID=A0AAU7AR72_9ACTN
MRTFTLTVRPGRFAVCRLAAAAAAPPAPPATAVLYSVTRTADELSIVCPEAEAPAGAVVEGGWRVLTLAGPFDLNTEVGVLVRILQPLADAGVGIFALSTYDTDHVLVHDAQLPQAVAALQAAGHTVDDA